MVVHPPVPPDPPLGARGRWLAGLRSFLSPIRVERRGSAWASELNRFVEDNCCQDPVRKLLFAIPAAGGSRAATQVGEMRGQVCVLQGHFALLAAQHRLRGPALVECLARALVFARRLVELARALDECRGVPRGVETVAQEMFAVFRGPSGIRRWSRGALLISFGEVAAAVAAARLEAQLGGASGLDRLAAAHLLHNNALRSLQELGQLQGRGTALAREAAQAELLAAADLVQAVRIVVGVTPQVEVLECGLS